MTTASFSTGNVSSTQSLSGQTATLSIQLPNGDWSTTSFSLDNGSQQVYSVGVSSTNNVIITADFNAYGESEDASSDSTTVVSGTLTVTQEYSESYIAALHTDVYDYWITVNYPTLPALSSVSLSLSGSEVVGGTTDVNSSVSHASNISVTTTWSGTASSSSGSSIDITNSKAGTYSETVTVKGGSSTLSSTISWTVPQPLSSLSLSMSGNAIIGGTTHFSESINNNSKDGLTTTWSGTVSQSGGDDASYTNTAAGTYSETVTVSGASSTLSSTLSWSVAKLVVSFSGASAPTIPLGSEGGETWSLSKSNDLTAVTYHLRYSNYGSSTLSNSTTLTSSTYIFNNSSVPNDETAGKLDFQFYGVDVYGNIGTTSEITVTVSKDFSTNLKISGVGITSPFGAYYASPVQNPFLYSYITISTTQAIELNLVYNWYSTTSDTIAPNDATEMAGKSASLYQLVGANYSGDIGVPFYFFVQGENIASTGSTFSTSAAVSIMWTDPLSVSIAPETMNFTAGVKSTKTFTVTASGAEGWKLTILQLALSTTVGTTYQQYVSISGYNAYGINSSGSNILFKSAASGGTTFYAWIESISSTNLNVWVKNVGGQKDIYLFIMSTSQFSGTTSYLGEAPQLSSTYGEYDNGASVFPFYDNFAGTSLNTNKWNSGESGGTITVNNGLTETIPYNASTGSYTYISSKISITGAIIIQSYANLNSFYTTDFRIVPVALTEYNDTAWHADNSVNEAGGGWVGNAYQQSGIDAETTSSTSSNGFVNSNYLSPNSNYNLFGVIYPDNGTFAVSYNSLSPYASTTSLVPSTPLYITISNWLNPSQTSFSTTYPMNVQWLRTITYVSSMPGVSISGAGYTSVPGSYSYQWYRSGSLVSGVSGNTYTISTTFSTSQSISVFALVTATNTKESLATQLAEIVVNGTVSVSLPFNEIYGTQGNTYQIVADASGGTLPYKYEWTFPTSSTVIKASSTANEALYFSRASATTGYLGVTVTDANGASARATTALFIYDAKAPNLVGSPSSVKVGDKATMSIVLSGSGYYSLKWYSNGSNIYSETLSDINSTSYGFISSTAGQYHIYVQATDTRDNTIINSNMVTINVFNELAINVSAQYGTTLAGSGDNFSASVSGGVAPYSFEWYYNTSESSTGVVFSSSQSAVFSTSEAETYYVFCHVSDAQGNDQNSAFTAITVYNVPSVSISGSVNVESGSLATYKSSIADGLGGYSYRWYFNGLSSTSAEYTGSTFSTTFSSTGNYSLYLIAKETVGSRSVAIPQSNQLIISVTEKPSKVSSISISEPLTITASFGSALTVSSSTTTAPSSTASLRMSVLVNGKNVRAFQIQSEKLLDMTGKLTFTTLRQYMFSTTSGATTYMQIGDAVEFYFVGNLVWTGIVQNIQKNSNMTYDITAYDQIYYLSSLRITADIASESNPVGAASLIGKVLDYSTVSYDVSSIGYEGLYASVSSTQPIYYELVELASALGYAFFCDNEAVMKLIPFAGSTTYSITENNNCIVSSKVNDVNYYFNQLTLEATVGGASSTVTVGSSTFAPSGKNGEIDSSKSLDMSWLGVVPSSSSTYVGSVEALAEKALKQFPDGYREVRLWYSATAPNATTFMAGGVDGKFSVTFRDGTVWNNLILAEVEITQSGLFLVLENFVRDVWSLLDSLAGLS